jgi:hypothetical protein
MKHADRFAEIVCASEETKLRFPKPLRHERKANRIGTADLEHAKKHFDRDAKFRAFVSGHECLLAPWKIAECSGKTEFAHITPTTSAFRYAAATIAPEMVRITTSDH